jgi:hypothetical protein
MKRSKSAISAGNLAHRLLPCRMHLVCSAQFLRISSCILAATLLSSCVTVFFPRVPRDVIVDKTPRPPTKDILVLRGEPNRPYRNIARLHAYHDSKTEGAPVETLIKKAKALGAHGIILAPSEVTSRVWTTSGDPLESSDLSVSSQLASPQPGTIREGTLFSARAIVFE